MTNQAHPCDSISEDSCNDSFQRNGEHYHNTYDLNTRKKATCYIGLTVALLLFSLVIFSATQSKPTVLYSCLIFLGLLSMAAFYAVRNYLIKSIFYDDMNNQREISNGDTSSAEVEKSCYCFKKNKQGKYHCLCNLTLILIKAMFCVPRKYNQHQEYCEQNTNNRSWNDNDCTRNSLLSSCSSSLSLCSSCRNNSSSNDVNCNDTMVSAADLEYDNHRQEPSRTSHNAANSDATAATPSANLVSTPTSLVLPNTSKLLLTPSSLPIAQTIVLMKQYVSQLYTAYSTLHTSDVSAVNNMLVDYNKLDKINSQLNKWIKDKHDPPSQEQLFDIRQQLMTIESNIRVACIRSSENAVSSNINSTESLGIIHQVMLYTMQLAEPPPYQEQDPMTNSDKDVLHKCPLCESDGKPVSSKVCSCDNRNLLAHIAESEIAESDCNDNQNMSSSTSTDITNNVIIASTCSTISIIEPFPTISCTHMDTSIPSSIQEINLPNLNDENHHNVPLYTPNMQTRNTRLDRGNIYTIGPPDDERNAPPVYQLVAEVSHV